MADTRLSGTYRIGIKRVAGVEVDPGRSNQHELNGVSSLRNVLGTERRTGITTRWVLLRDDGDHRYETHSITWYDSRENSPNRSAEWRLYYTEDTQVESGDLLAIVTRAEDDEVVFTAATPGSSWESQLVQMFGDPPAEGGVTAVDLETVPEVFSRVFEEFLSVLGWDDQGTRIAADANIEEIAQKYQDAFPPSAELSEIARGLVSIDPSDPDSTLIRWWDSEETLFRAIERIHVERRLSGDNPFTDVDDFVSYSLTVQNRRKSRAGRAFENHLGELFHQNNIVFSHDRETEGKRRPDFLFPGVENYRDGTFESGLLTMLGSKTTCKDRWRQVLTEADRIDVKHLCTLEPGISSSQRDEMIQQKVILVAPEKIRKTYKPRPAEMVLNIAEFLELVGDRQSKAGL